MKTILSSNDSQLFQKVENVCNALHLDRPINSNILENSDNTLVILDARYIEKIGSILSLIKRNSDLVFIVILNKFDYKKYLNKFMNLGVFVLYENYNEIMLLQIIASAVASSVKFKKIKVKLDDEKLINRAKCVLIDYLGMSEQDAHFYMEKKAMDTQNSKVEIAKNILNTYY